MSSADKLEESLDLCASATPWRSALSASSQENKPVPELVYDTHAPAAHHIRSAYCKLPEPSIHIAEHPDEVTCSYCIHDLKRDYDHLCLWYLGHNLSKFRNDEELRILAKDNPEDLLQIIWMADVVSSGLRIRAVEALVELKDKPRAVQELIRIFNANSPHIVIREVCIDALNELWVYEGAKEFIWGVAERKSRANPLLVEIAKDYIKEHTL